MQSKNGDFFRISPQQKHLWLLEQGDKSQVYFSQIAVHIKGNLKPDILKAALENIVKRQEILRTTFHCLPGMSIPLQFITESSTLSVHDYNLSGFAPQEQQTKIDALFQEARLQTFDLGESPLLHIALIRLSSCEHILFVSLPALCADMATLNNLVHEISRSYTAYLHGKELSDESMQYADISEWLNELLESEDTETGREYWRQQDISSLLNLKLPLENQPSGKARFEPQSLTLKISPDTVAKIETLVQKYDTSVSVFLLACWQVLLWRLTGQSDLVIGTACDGRKYQELKEAFGLLAKYLPTHFNLKVNFRFREILERISESSRDVHKWQEYFNWEQTAATDGNLAKPHFFPFSFDFAEQSAKYIAGDVSFSIYKQYACIDQFKVRLSSVHRDDFLLLEFYYDSSLFPSDNIRILSGQYRTLLESAINNPETAIGDLEILSDIERQRLLIEFNDTKTDYPKDKCIHQLFEEQVERTPDSIAAVFENQHLTYTELNARANQLAHQLQRLGVGPEVLVAICVERSLEMVIGILGILKAGGAYVPLDSAYPQERLAFMLEDAQVPVLLTQQRLVKSLPEHRARVVCLDTDWEAIARESNKKPVSRAKPENLAYVIYTSGSTGKPKGTMIPHQGLVNYLSWCTKAYAVADGCGAPVQSSIGFDATITSLFSPLLVGQRIVLLPEKQEIEALSAVLQSQSNFSLVKITPAHLEMLGQFVPANKEAGGQTRALIIGGEALLGKSLSFWRRNAPDTRLINEYGPTETVVGCCVYEVSDQTSLSGAVPIGRPIANTQLYILDQNLRPVPIGARGELHVSGAGLARGYLNRPDLTEEKFIPNPFSDEPGARLYKTGDLARYLPDGNIEFLGRLDHQVKIRGFRIELGEIEAVLVQHPDLFQTVVIAREDQPGNKRLVTYVVPNQERVPTPRELRQFLKEKLPEYMVPAAFVMLEALPQTPSGKVDRRALPAPDTSQRSLDEGFVAPRTPTEEILAAIWAEVLGLEQIGIHDNFFELGGDSILSIQIIARANQAGLQLTPRQLFQHQTIAELAALAGTSLPVQAEQGLVTGPVPLTPIQHWFFEQNLPEPHHFNQSVLLEVPPDLKPELLKQVVQQLLVHHDALRLRFVRDESIWQQVNVGLEETVSLTVVDFSQLSSGEQQTALEAAAAELQASLHLSEGPLMRVALFNLGIDKPARLLLVIHHLAVDGISWRILLEDISRAYQQLSRGKDIQLQPKSTSFKDWAYRLMEYGQSEALTAELDYWLAQTRSEVAPLPVDYPSGKEANTVASAAHVSVSLSVEQTRALLQEVPYAYNTQINDVLLTALVQTFAQWTGERSLLVDLEGHGREGLFEDVDLLRTVGWFTTIFSVLLELGEVSHPGEALKSVKEQLRCLPNRGIGYGLLRYLSRNAETRLKLQALPQAEVSFNYLGQLDQVLSESPLWGLAKESSGSEHSRLGSRSYLLEVNGFVAEGKLQLDWTYSQNVHQQATVECLAQGFLEALKSLIAHCQSPEAGGYTPSDFPEAELSQEELEELVAELSMSEK